MISLLNLILCTLRNLILAVAWAGAEVINGLVAAIGALVAAIVAVLPSMPSAPDPSGFSGTALGWVAWFVPAGAIVGALAAMLAIYLLFRLVKIALNWAKAL